MTDFRPSKLPWLNSTRKRCTGSLPGFALPKITNSFSSSSRIVTDFLYHLIRVPIFQVMPVGSVYVWLSARPCLLNVAGPQFLCPPAYSMTKDVRSGDKPRLPSLRVQLSCPQAADQNKSSPHIWRTGNDPRSSPHFV